MADERHSAVHLVDRESRRIVVTDEAVTLGFPLNAMPNPLYSGMLNAVDMLDDDVDIFRGIWRSNIMKPTLVTFDRDKPFPVNTATKIVRLTLKDDVIAERIDDLEGNLLEMFGQPFEDTMDDRISLYRNLYLDETLIDRFRFGIAEMYGDRSYQNIRKNPRVTLHFSWPTNGSPTWLSYEISCIAEIVEQETPFYRFMRMMRQIFSREFLELRDEEYPCAYRLWISDVREKTLSSQRGFVPRDQ